jgi:peptide/nickel transport system substrate-binding protein
MEVEEGMSAGENGTADQRMLARLIARRLTRREMVVGGAKVAAGISLADFLAACATTSTSKSASTNTVTVGISTPDGPFTADPGLTQNFATGYLLLWAVAEQVYRRDLNGKQQPNLATEWSVSSDQLTWTLTLRSGVKMQDGSAFTSRDVQTAINRVIQNPKYNLTAFAAFTKNIASIKLIDDLHIAITTTKPYPTLIIDMPAPIATDYYQRVGDAQFNAQPIAAGAWKFVSLQTNQSFTFERHDDFWDKSRLPNFKNLVLKVIPDESTRLAGLQSGDLDVIQGIGPQSVQQLQGAKGVNVLRNDNVGIGQMYLPSLKTEPNSPIQDLRVRQALLYAIDRASMAKTLFRDLALPLPVAVPPNALGYDTKLKPYPHDVAKAKQLLAAAGQTNLTVTITHQAVDSVFPNIGSVAQAIASYWQAVGVKAEISPMESATLQQIRRAGKLKGALLIAGTAVSYFELAYIAPVTFASNGPNYNMADPKLDAIIAKLVVATDINDRTRLGTEFTDYVYESLPILPLLGLPSFLAHGPKVKLKTQAANAYLLTWYLQAT